MHAHIHHIHCSLLDLSCGQVRSDFLLDNMITGVLIYVLFALDPEQSLANVPTSQDQEVSCTNKCIYISIIS